MDRPVNPYFHSPERLKEIKDTLEQLYAFIATNNGAIEFHSEMRHTPTEIPSSGMFNEFCEGNRTISLTITEHHHRNWFISRYFNSKKKRPAKCKAKKKKR